MEGGKCLDSDHFRADRTARKVGFGMTIEEDWDFYWKEERLLIQLVLNRITQPLIENLP